MKTFALDPHWGWWIVWYFYLGGIAAGAYFLASLAGMFGSESDRSVMRAGYLLAAPLVAVCGVLLIVDLNTPLRFWHMLLDADTGRPHIRFWSPMSVGAWALLVFGMISTISFIGAIVECRSERWRVLATGWHNSVAGRLFDLLGTVSGFFIASYTGVLLTASNQPLWTNSSWLGAVFLASAAATGLAAIRLAVAVTPPRSPGAVPCSLPAAPATHDRTAVDKLELLEPWVWTLELAAAALFLSSMGAANARILATLPVGWTFAVGLFGMGICVPALLRWRPALFGRMTGLASAVAVLCGGFLLRYSILAAPAAIHRMTAGNW